MIASFPPSAGDSCRILVLGTMPGVESLRQQQYYAHPRNAFWSIMGDIWGFSPELPYPERLAALNGQGIGLWDTVRSCERRGSLDSDIRNPVFNDFATLFRRCPNLRKVCLNGKGAGKFFQSYLKTHADRLPELEVCILPSTSPAYASMTYGQKLKAWRLALKP
jgi:TDG/mug DNA glycosylase family protein